MALDKKKMLRITLWALAIGVYLFFFIRNNFLKKENEAKKAEAFIFKDLRGPEKPSVAEAKKTSSWRRYNYSAQNGLAILLTDTNSAWLGLVHGFKSFGIPFTIQTSADSALKSDVVLIYPLISGKVLAPAQLQKIAAALQGGKTIIGINVQGGLLEEFGLSNAKASRKNFKVRINDSTSALLSEFTDEKEQEISLGSEKDFNETVGTFSYANPQTKPLLTYANGEACLTQYYYKGGGKAFALGIDLGEFILRSQNERGFNAQRSYVNAYEPSADVLMRIIKNIYSASTPNAVFLNTVPQNKKLAVCLTHDIDFTRSIANAAKYARLEKNKGVTATYFIQTKYVKDWNDDVFYNEAGAAHIKKISQLGMEVASHSVAHSHVFSKFALGTGTEQYPDYMPEVLERDSAQNGTVLGELRVSKFLLEKTAHCAEVVSFRSGHLSYPFCLPQALQAAGFKYSSCVTANNVLSHLPYQMQYNRESEEEMDLFEFPVTIEDEEKPRLDLRLQPALALARRLERYGAFMNVLIHTDILGYKATFEEQLIDSLYNEAWFGTLKEYACWWRERNSMQWSVSGKGSGRIIHFTSTLKAKDQSITVPRGWLCTDKNIKQTGNTVFISLIDKTLDLHFAVLTKE